MDIASFIIRYSANDVGTEQKSHHELSDNTADKNIRSLENLMTFHRQEVQGEEMVVLSRTGFASNQVTRKKEYVCTPLNEISGDPATAAALVSLKSIDNKVACKPHLSHNYFSAKKITLDEKLKILSKKGACYSCLTKSNYISRQCDLKSKLKCNFCSLSHYDIMCSKKLDKHLSVKNSPSTITLSNKCSRDRTVYLQTLCVIAQGRGRERRIRILLDSASQYYHLTALNGDYSCCLEVLSEEKICNSVTKITDEQILNNLRELNIEFSDSFSEGLEIDLLVGSNVLGRILMKKCCELDSGLSVVETKLGNTVIGMQDDVCHIDRNVMKTLSMYVRNIKLTDLWSLENLGISNPTLEESKQNSYEDALDDFQQKLTILPHGRYELQLPWKHDPVNLPDNKDLTWARHEKVIKRAESNGFLREYQKVFEDWENLRIIEIVPEEEVKAVKCHYLAPRPVIKLQSETTKYRPCFDGPACENGLDYPIGLSADIEKAFLMLSVHPKDRDYLRFSYPSKGELVYRHCRIVFGLNSSPFLLNASINHLLDNAPLEYFTVPRYIAINETSELHIFVDASKSSYGACVFVRTVVENDVKVTLLRSKARVAPLKSLTIPRLELMSCCIGARLANSIIRALNLPGIKVIYWSDSEVALWWIREQGNWSVFVTNRVKEIRELTQFQSWRHVPSNMNIADLLSRGCTPQKMLDSKWWEGPLWLKNNREQWPANEINCEPKDVILEKRKSELVNVNISEELVPWVHVEERKLSELSSDDIENAERLLIRLVQGIDLAGPLFTRDGGKVWIVLYTCTIYRAIHIELVSSLSTECFMLSLRRFIARRTRPETIYTGNETNFVGTYSELKNLDWDKIMQETDIKPIKWKFNPPTVAWWERLVRVIKELLNRTLGKAILTYEELLTVLCDCKEVVNYRPLTYVSEDPNDLIPLTPSLFLNGKSSYDTIDLDLSEFSKFQKRIRYRRKLIHDFRSGFRKEYLGQLRQKAQKSHVMISKLVMS
ncbi:uncharacterized protein TNCV_4536761 [Trichonephila clavipes]|nr:uncharacterized protein TNCV_4536761 [Trichonephila clavipes]